MSPRNNWYIMSAFLSFLEVEFAGAPIEPFLSHLCQNDSWVRATVSWLPPIQANGEIAYYGVQHAELGPRGLIISETAYVEPQTNTGPVSFLKHTVNSD